MAKDPTDPIRQQAVTFPGVAKGTACSQSSFAAGKGKFLFIGPGAKGIGFKAMFKLDASMPQARALAVSEPTRFEVGSTGWVTTRFTAEEPLQKSIWQKWLKESYELTYGAAGATHKTGTKTTTKTKAGKTATKTSGKRKAAKKTDGR